MFKVSSKKIPNRNGEIPVVVRLYGNNTEAIIDRKKELKVYHSFTSYGSLLTSPVDSYGDCKE